MKFAVIFLFALVVISHQQLQGPRGVIWVSPYYLPPQPPLNNYQSPHHKDQAYFNQDNVDGDEYYQSRIGGAFDAQQQQQNARLFFNSNRNGVTITVTLTTATVQSCIPAVQLAPGAGACRRKRRPIRELDDSPIVTDEDTQFPIDPSETLKVMPTALSLPSIKREAHQHQLTEKETDQNAGLLSSKDEVLSGDASKTDLATHLREKRLFFNLANNFAMMASPVTTFVFVPTTILKTVSLGGASSVLCLPAGYAKC